MLSFNFLVRCYILLLLFSSSVSNAAVPHGKKSLSRNPRISNGKSTQITKTVAKSTSVTITSSQVPTVTTSSTTLNASVTNCLLKLPNDVLTADGLATPFELQAPCSQSVFLQQSFAEAAIIDPTTGNISIYHPLVINAGMTPQVNPVVPTIPDGAEIALWFGFNGDVLQLVDQNGEDTNQSPTLKDITCVNGLPGTEGDVFGQVSWCNTGPFWSAVNTAVQENKLAVPALGTDSQGNTCPTSRSFVMVDACPSDNVPTQYLLLSDGSTVQDTAANREMFPSAEVINNGSDEALLSLSLDPAIGCTPFLAPSLDDPGSTVSSLATSELQANQLQQSPIALVPLNDPDCLLTSNGDVSVAKTDAYRSGVNQPQVSDSSPAVAGQLDFYCNSMIDLQPSFILSFQDKFSATTSPDSMTGNNLFTFMCARYLMSLQQLNCPSAGSQAVAIKTDNAGVATACTIQNSVLTTTAVRAAENTSSSLAVKKVSSRFASRSVTRGSMMTMASAMSARSTA